MFQVVQRRVDELKQTKGATDGLSRNQVVLAALHGLICRGALDATTPFVPLLTPQARRATTRGSASAATSGPSPPAGSDPPPVAPSAAAADELRPFDPSAA
jgi:hypothetical protein